MSKNEVRVQWISTLILVLKAALAWSSVEALPRDYYALHLRNPFMRYYDCLIYSMGTDGAFIIKTVPNILPGLSARSDAAPSRHQLDYTQPKSNGVINISQLGRRVPVFERYDFNKRHDPYSKPISTTVAPYRNKWKPIRGNEQTFNIQLTKSITVSSPAKWTSSHQPMTTRSPPSFQFRNQVPLRATNPNVLNPSLIQENTKIREKEVSINDSSQHKFVTTPKWAPFPASGYSQNTELLFQKAFAPFRDSVTGPSNDGNDEQPKVLFRVNHSFRNGRVREKDTVGNVPFSNSNERHSIKLTTRVNKLPTRTTKPTVPPNPFINFHHQPHPRPFTNTRHDRKEDFRTNPLVSHELVEVLNPHGNFNKSDIESDMEPQWTDRQVEERLNIQPLFEIKSKVTRDNPEILTDKTYDAEIDPDKFSELVLSPNNKKNIWEDIFDSRALNPTAYPSSNKTYRPAVTYSPFSNHKNRQNYSPNTEISTVSVSFSEYSRKYSQNSFEFTTARTYFSATIPTDSFAPATENTVQVSSEEVIQDTTSAISNYILKHGNQQLSESENVDVHPVPEIPEVKQNEPPVSNAPKVKITGGVLAGVLIASLIFLGFLTGAAVYTFHQWKFSKYRKNSSKSPPTFPPEYLDNSFTGNTYIHNNIYLPTPQNIEEISSMDSDSFISGIEAVTVENYSSENAKNTAV